MATGAPWSREVQLTKELFEDHAVGKYNREQEEEKNLLVVCNHKEWDQEQRACREKRRVVVMEITNPFSEGCARVRSMFARFAKEFDSDVCIRVITGPFPLFLTIEKVCRDVGAVEELPTVLLLYYDQPNHIKRKTYKGEKDIQTALLNGQLKKKFKEFIDEWLKQMLEESMRGAEKELQVNLSKISRKLSQDESVKKGEDQVIGDEVIELPPIIPEVEKEQEETQNDDTDYTCATTEQQVKKDSSNTRDNDDAAHDPTQERTSSRPPSANYLPKSRVLNRNDIEVGEKLGQGGFGVVFKAMWKKRTVAVKSCNGNLLEFGAAEVNILASLPSHPNVVKFFGVALSDDKITTLIVTEFAVGGSLFTALHEKKEEAPTADQSLGWAVQIASGMEHLHSHHIIHRDLKSPNVLLSHGYLKVCDFGTARQLSQTCTPTGQAGTYRWMAPEIADPEHSKINNKCDVFSYGMILYEIFELKIPFFEIPSGIKVCCEIMNGKRPLIPTKLPPYLQPLLCDCWSRDPAQRPSFEKIVMTIQTEAYEKDNEQ